ncbi:MAG: ribosome biogenesis GTP-binding protein YihA/YsxC [Thermodesulfobacteriota bacterium]
MKIRSAEFTTSAVRSSQYPADGLPEIALVGKSNVGKSSLINTLVGRKGLAKTSSTPGKTRTINFYRINGSFYLVDLPGYGYAKVPLRERKGWKQTIEQYFTESSGLRGAVVILDSRRDPGKPEFELYRWIEELEIPLLTVLTKSDKFSKNKLSNRIIAIKKSLGFDGLLTFSATGGEGKTELLKAMDKMLGEEIPLDKKSKRGLPFERNVG